MRRLVQVRLLFILIALALVPTLALPFASRLRTVWTRFWEPKPEEFDWEAYAAEPHVFVNGVYLCPTDWSSVTTVMPPPVEAIPVVVIDSAEPKVEIEAAK